MKLLIFNYSMNRDNQVFSHQRRIVLELAEHFDEIDVITSENYLDAEIDSVNVFSINWKLGHRIRNLIVFYLIAIPLLIKHRGGILFSHMTEVQSALIALPCRILGIRHVLWYAHKSPSLYLRLSYPFVDIIATSTFGSCPVAGRKVVALGQSIDATMTEKITRLPSFPPRNWYHVGRIDPSKNIEIIINAIKVLKQRDPEVKLHFYGTPSSKKFESYFSELKSSHSNEKWIVFNGHLNSSQLAEVTNLHDGFIHAFWGSLDKALVEAIMLRRIVVSANPEYLHQFESVKIDKLDLFEELMRQINNLLGESQDSAMLEVERKFQIAHSSHELKGWVERLLRVLKKSEVL